MARYVYFCSLCDKPFEVDKPMADSSRLESCPKCQTQGERVFTAPGITIKGSPIRFKDGGELDSGSCGGGCCDGGQCPI